MIRGLGADDPRQVGPYRLVARLGSGGMGRVFLGRSAGGRLVAVKVIRAELAEEPGFRARFDREVTAARKVNGLFTAVLVDAGSDGPVPWLATGYVPGPSLAEAVTMYGPLPGPSAVTLAAGLAEALKAIHESGVIHRDLKPSNVLIADDGPRVIDFGISRAAEASVLTQTGSVMGSPGFMSPEQAEGGEISPASDVFSLGALLTFAATGEGPFGTGSMPALLYRVVHHPPSLDRVPAELRPVIERCLIKDPSQRATTAELLAELDSAGPAADWLPASVAEALSQFAAPIRAATGPVQLDLPAQRPTGTAQPAQTPGHAADRPAQPAAEPAPAAQVPPAAAAPVLAAAAPVAVEDRPTSDFRITDPSVPGLPLRLDSDLLPRGFSGPPRPGGAPSRVSGEPWSPGSASGLAVGGQPSPAGVPSRPASPPRSPGRVSDLAGNGPPPPGSTPSRAVSPPWSPGRVPGPAVDDQPPPGSAAPPSASGPPGSSRPSVMMSPKMQRALAEAVAQPPPSWFGARLGGPGWRGGLWLLVGCILVAAAAVALELLTGFGQRSEPRAPQQTPASGAGAPSTPAALHRHTSPGSARARLTNVAAGDAAQAAAGVGGSVQSAGHRAAKPTASSTPSATSTRSAHAQAPVANPNPEHKTTSRSKANPGPKPTHTSPGPTGRW